LSTIAVLGAIYSIWTIIGAGLEAFYWGIALMVAGVPVYVAMKVKARDAIPAAAGEQ
jgi:APA family basic amino acid/polyamine antiporter